jgi:hypothetical protein
MATADKFLHPRRDLDVFGAAIFANEQASMKNLSCSFVDRISDLPAELKTLLIDPFEVNGVRIHSPRNRSKVPGVVWGRAFHPVPQDFVLPTGNVKRFWDLWWEGDPRRTRI